MACALAPWAARGASTKDATILRFSMPKTGRNAISSTLYNAVEGIVNMTLSAAESSPSNRPVMLFFEDDASDLGIMKDLYSRWALADLGDTDHADILLGPLYTPWTYEALVIANCTGKAMILWAPETEWQGTGFIRVPEPWLNDVHPYHSHKTYETLAYNLNGVRIDRRSPTTSTTTVGMQARACESSYNSQCGFINGTLVDCVANRYCCSSGFCGTVDGILDETTEFACTWGSQYNFNRNSNGGCASAGVSSLDDETALGSQFVYNARGCPVGPRRLQDGMDTVDVSGLGFRNAEPNMDWMFQVEADASTHLREDYVSAVVNGTSFPFESVLMGREIQVQLDTLEKEVDATAQYMQVLANFAVMTYYNGSCWQEKAAEILEQGNSSAAATCPDPDGALWDENFPHRWDIRVPRSLVLRNTLIEVAKVQPEGSIMFAVEEDSEQAYASCVSGIQNAKELGISRTYLDIVSTGEAATWSRWIHDVAPDCLTLCGSSRFIADVIFVLMSADYSPKVTIAMAPRAYEVVDLTAAYAMSYILQPVPWPASLHRFQEACANEVSCGESLTTEFHLKSTVEWLRGLERMETNAPPRDAAELQSAACGDDSSPVSTDVGYLSFNCDGSLVNGRRLYDLAEGSTNIFVPLWYGKGRPGVQTFGSNQTYAQAKVYILPNETELQSDGLNFDEIYPFARMRYPAPQWSQKEAEVYPCIPGCIVSYMPGEDTTEGNSTYQDYATACHSCPPGRFRTKSDTICIPCTEIQVDEGTVPAFADGWGFNTCFPIRQGGDFGEGENKHAVTPVAQRGYFRFETTVNEPRSTSEVCDARGNPHAGYLFFPCDFPEYCLGNNTCMGNNTGIMCLYCKVGYTNLMGMRQAGNWLDKQCVECPHFAEVSFILVMLAAFFISLVCLMSGMVRLDCKRAVAIRGPIVRMLVIYLQLLGTLNDTDESAQRQSLLVLDIIFYRPFDLLALDCWLKHGYALESEMRYIGGYWKVSFAVYFFGCFVIAMFHTGQLVYDAVLPPMKVWGPLGVITYFFGSFSEHYRTSKADDSKLRREGQFRYPVSAHENYALEDGPGYNYTKRGIVNGILIHKREIFRHWMAWTIIMYPICLRNLLKMTLCSGSYGPVPRLRANLNVKCGQRALALGWLLAYISGAICWTLFVPFVCWYNTWKTRQVNFYNVNTRLAMGLLLQGYKSSCAYWQVVVFVRSASILFTNHFLHLRTRVTSKVCILMVSLAIHEIWQPHDHSQRFALRNIDRWMHVGAILTITSSYADLHSSYQFGGVIKDSAVHVLRHAAFAIQVCIFVKAAWVLLVISFNPKWYELEKKRSDANLHANLHFGHHLYLWLVDRIRGKNRIIVGWDTGGDKYVDMEHLSRRSSKIFLHSLQVTMKTCLNSRELFPPAFLQVAFQEALRRAVAGSDATFEVWQHQRHKTLSWMCTWGAHELDEQSVAHVPSHVEKSKQFWFQLPWSEDFLEQFAENVNKLRKDITTKFPNKRDIDVQNELIIYDCLGQDIHRQLKFVVKKRFPLTVRWVADRSIMLEEIVAALADVSSDIQDHHPDVHRKFAQGQTDTLMSDDVRQANMRKEEHKREEDAENRLRAELARVGGFEEEAPGEGDAAEKEGGDVLRRLFGEDIGDLLYDEQKVDVTAAWESAVTTLTKEIHHASETRLETEQLKALREELRALHRRQKEVRARLAQVTRRRARADIARQHLKGPSVAELLGESANRTSPQQGTRTSMDVSDRDVAPPGGSASQRPAELLDAQGEHAISPVIAGEERHSAAASREDLRGDSPAPATLGKASPRPLPKSRTSPPALSSRADEELLKRMQQMQLMHDMRQAKQGVAPLDPEW